MPTDTKEMVAWMKGHESAIHSLSVHASGRYALTTSADTAQLWDLDTFQRKRKLSIKEDVGILQVSNLYNYRYGCLEQCSARAAFLRHCRTNFEYDADKLSPWNIWGTLIFCLSQDFESISYVGNSYAKNNFVFHRNSYSYD